MKIAILGMTALMAVAFLAPSSSGAAVPEGKVAVVRVTAVDGLAAFDGPRSESRATAFTFDGTWYDVDRSALAGLDGVQTLVLIDRRTDKPSGGRMIRAFEQEVRAFSGTSFEVTDLPGKNLGYQVAMIGGNLRLLGDGDQILATGGEYGPYYVWKITGVDLVDKDAIRIH